MSRCCKLLWITVVVALSGCSSLGQSHSAHNPKKGEASVHDQVVFIERAFAKSMADRDFKAFSGFLSSEAIFFNGNTVEHGADQIKATWKPYFNGAAAPFSWVPDNVQVLPSGKLALSTGPVYIQGKEVGRYNSIWRLDSDGWHIVFDKGEAVCTAKP